MTWQIHEGDCLQVMKQLPSDSFDAVITDPPYCSGGFSESQKQAAKGQGLRSQTRQEVGWFVNDNMTTGGLVWLLREMATEAYRLLKDGGSLCAFTDWRMYPHLAPAMESAGLRLQNMVVWDKGNPGLGFGFRPTHELVIHLVKSKGVYHDQTVGNVLRVNRIPSAQRRHQTEKPVELMAMLIRVTTPEGGNVLDPFAGSGSTLEAAIKLGRNAVGIEKGAEYCEIARQRLTQAEQMTLFPVVNA